MVFPGDLVLVRGDGWISSAIRFFTRRFGESRSRVSHVGVIVDNRTIVEALRTAVRRPFVAAYAGSELAIYRPIHLHRVAEVVAKAESYVGREYGYLKILAHSLDWALQGTYFFRRFTNSDAYPICSWLVAHAYAAGGVAFGVAPGAASPDDCWDYVTQHPEEFQCIHPLSPFS